MPVVLPVTWRNAFDTVPPPELYAAAANNHEPNRVCRSFRYVSAASVAFSGFVRSSVLPRTMRPNCRAVADMNCHNPFAFTGEVAFGLNSDSIIAR